MSAIAIWAVAGLVYGAFFVWYRGFRRPLSPAEIDAAIVEASSEESPERQKLLRDFLTDDDGRAFVMVNVIHVRDRVAIEEDGGKEISGQRMLGRYMKYMWPQLLKRACHPVLAGGAAAGALDLWGIEGAEQWSQAGMMRYRSRRDLLEISANQAFRDSHVYKQAAMIKTIAFPIQPFVLFGGVQWLLGLATFSLAALLHILFV